MRLLSLTVMLACAAAPSFAAEKATFLDGIYATGDNCAKAKAIASKKTEPSVSTYPDTLESDGFKSWESACRFTKIFEDKPGESWVAIMLCSEGPTVAPQTYAFLKLEDGSFDVAATGQSEADNYTRCDTPPFRSE